MRLSVVCVGGKMPSWVDAGVAEYSKRLPRELNLRWHEIPLARRGRDSQPEALREAEGRQILKAIPAGDRVIALDVAGRPWSTADLARQLDAWQMSGANFSLLIGGPDGLSEACRERAERLWSLSPLTLPHPLVRILLAEQLYRAWTITVNHPYHRA
jgi:23S rRNA (pseudouridine1915-N3)-methyltransferase